jgi:HK97 gp10 family phage protein
MADDPYIKGLAELLSELRDLPGNIEKNALRTGIFRAAQLMRDRLKAAAPMSSGNPPKGKKFREKYPPGTLKKSIKAKRRRGTREEVAAGITGAFYAKWVEFGHMIKSHGRKKADRQVLGHVPANPFIARTYEASKEEALQEVRRGILDAIGKQVEKLRAKMPKDN